MSSFKPEHYNSLSPYLIIDDAQALVDQLKTIFDAKELRRFDRGNGKIMHLELLLDDSVIMISDSTETYTATKTTLHMYVPDVLATFNRAVENGCEVIEKPASRPGDPDLRGSFYDRAGNFWSVSTQQPG
jgi:PhnB protein